MQGGGTNCVHDPRAEPWRSYTTATLYVGNLEFKASNKALKDEVDGEFQRIGVEDVVIRERMADLAIMLPLCPGPKYRR
jgi:hypothetical protein